MVLLWSVQLPLIYQWGYSWARHPLTHSDIPQIIKRPLNPQTFKKCHKILKKLNILVLDLRAKYSLQKLKRK